MGACSSIGGVLLSKQGDGANVSVSSPKMNITVVKLDPNQGPSMILLLLLILTCC